MRMIRSVLLLAAIFGLVVPLAGRAEAITADGPKYQIVKADQERVWRLNTETGEIAVCQMEAGRMVCASSGETIDRTAATAEDLEKARERERTAVREDKFATMDRLMAFFERFVRMVSELRPGSGEATP